MSEFGGAPILTLKRPFRFIFHRLEVFSADGGAPIGAIEKRWSWVRRIYEITDRSGRVVATLFGPFFRPWTFEVRQNDRKVGSIVKRWTGLGTEMFTDADNFGVDFGELHDEDTKALVFAATVLVDVVHFERSK